MIAGGATRICFVIAPGKSDIIEYYGGNFGAAEICYVVQPQAGGLCDALFRALPLIHDDEMVLVGLPDTVWFPADGLRFLGNGDLSFLLFPVTQPQLFDAVVSDVDVGTIHGYREAINLLHERDAFTHAEFSARPARLLHVVGEQA